MTASTVPVRVLHNLTRDPSGYHTAWETGFLPEHRLEEVFAYDTVVADNPLRTCEAVYRVCGNAPPEVLSAHDTALAEDYLRRNRTLCVGDVVIIGETAWACAKVGFERVHLSADNIVSNK